MVVHAVHAATDGVHIGFVVPRAVGNAVTRNRTKRRLRHVVAQLLPSIPSGTDLVVRALPAAANRDTDLQGDVVKASARALQRLGIASPTVRAER